MVKSEKNFAKLLPFPENPVNASGDWLLVESHIGTKLPSDFKRFIEKYGTGAIGLMPIWIFNPFGDDYVDQCNTIRSRYNDLFSESPELQTYPLFPEKHGLLYFGSTGNGDYLHWYTKGDPDTWTVVVHDFGMSKFSIFDLTFTFFFIDLLSQGSQTQSINVFPKDFFFAPVKFTPTAANFVWPLLD